MTLCVRLIVCVRLTGRCICTPNTLFMEGTMKHQKDTVVRCVYIALRWSAVASARFSIDILLRWSKETSWHRRAWCVFCRSELCSRMFSGIRIASKTRSYREGSLWQNVYTPCRLVLNEVQKDASEPNSTDSSRMDGKLINISIPVILWSFDTISESASSGSQNNLPLWVYRNTHLSQPFHRDSYVHPNAPPCSDFGRYPQVGAQ